MKVDEARSATGDPPASTARTPETRAEQEKKSPGKQNRRARGIAPASRSKTSVKRNHVHSRANGQDRASSPDAAVPASDGQGSTASVDASGASAASAAASAAAGADREAHAEAAHAPNGRARSRQAKAGPRPRVPGDAKARVVAGEDSTSSGAQEKVPPGEVPLPTDPAEFVEEIHRCIDLFRVWQALLECKDEKIRQRAVERLTDLRYKGMSALAEEPQQIVIDIDSAVARRAAEGARK
jgi:hypothetical protein